MCAPAIILVNPQMGQNIGAAARVMLNFGLSDLRIVNPRDGWPNDKANAMAAGAASVVKNAQIFDSLSSSVVGLKSLYAATSRPRDMVKPVISPEELSLELQENSAIIFGSEANGLSNEDITLCDKIVSIPVGSEYKSLNLAQAVGIIVYEVMKASGVKKFSKINELAQKSDIVDMLVHLETELDKANFFKVIEKKPTMLRNINNIFTRNNLTSQEVKTLRGIIKNLSEKL